MNITVTYRFTNTRLIRTWVRACSVLRHVIGTARAIRWAKWGAERFVKVKVVEPKLFGGKARRVNWDWARIEGEP